MHISKEILEKLGVASATTKDVPVTKHEALQAEKNLELKMIEKGIARFHKSIAKTKSRKREKDGKPRELSESVTVYGQELAKGGLLPMCEAIENTSSLQQMGMPLSLLQKQSYYLNVFLLRN